MLNSLTSTQMNIYSFWIEGKERKKEGEKERAKERKNEQDEKRQTVFCVHVCMCL